MSHQVEKMMFTGETPWHGLGTKVEPGVRSAQAIVDAGLDWNVDTVDLLTSDGQFITNHKATRRTSDGRILGVVGRTFKPLQNRDAFNFFDAFVEAGEASYETAGSLRGGRRVFILAKLNRDPLVIGKDDEVNKYVLLSNGHDGTLAVRVGFTPIRVVCSNTLAMSHSHRASKLLRIRHTSKTVDTLTKVREVMNLADASFEAEAEQYRKLARTPINRDDFTKFVTKVFAVKKLDDNGDEMPPVPTTRVLEGVSKLFEEGRGAQLETARGTVWGAYQAINEYLGYERGSDNDIRLDSMWYGDAAKKNQTALQYAYQLVG